MGEIPYCSTQPEYLYKAALRHLPSLPHSDQVSGTKILAALWVRRVFILASHVGAGSHGGQWVSRRRRVTQNEEDSVRWNWLKVGNRAVGWI